MLTFILLLAAYIPLITFTVNWKLPWEFSARHCTSGWRRLKCKAEEGCNQVRPIQGHLESGEVFQALSGALVQESMSGGGQPGADSWLPKASDALIICLLFLRAEASPLCRMS